MIRKRKKNPDELSNFELLQWVKGNFPMFESETIEYIVGQYEDRVRELHKKLEEPLSHMNALYFFASLLRESAQNAE